MSQVLDESIEIFKLIATDQLKALIVENTNLYATQFMTSREFLKNY